MTKGRLEAFTDGVLAILVTIMVLELRPPNGTNLSSLKPLFTVFISYILSFVNICTYWNNHHHMFQAAHKINGSILWANAHLLFWLSVLPFATAWMGENNFAVYPVALYGFVSLMAGVAYYLLAHCLVELHGKDSPFSKALGSDRKGKLSVIFYITGIAFSFLQPLI